MTAKIHVTFEGEQDVIDKIDALAKRMKLPRSYMIRYLLSYTTTMAGGPFNNPPASPETPDDPNSIHVLGLK